VPDFDEEIIQYERDIVLKTGLFGSGC